MATAAFDILSRSARLSTAWRSHDMPPFRCIEGDHKRLGDHRRVWRSVCRKCGMSVDVNVRPQPNEAHVAGEAVALNCTGRKQDVRT
jgi:hypothetical protein